MPGSPSHDLLLAFMTAPLSLRHDMLIQFIQDSLGGPGESAAKFEAWLTDKTMTMAQGILAGFEVPDDLSSLEE